jgi:hypothetical protein
MYMYNVKGHNETIAYFLPRFCHKKHHIFIGLLGSLNPIFLRDMTNLLIEIFLFWILFF